MSNQITEKYIIPPLASGLCAAGAVAIVYGTSAVPFKFVNELSAPIAFFAVAAAADLGGTFATDAISDVNTIRQLDDFQRMAVKPVISGVMMLPLSYYLIASSNVVNMAKIAGIGAVSNVGGSYLSTMINSTM
jgi:hypothetical protein